VSGYAGCINDDALRSSWNKTAFKRRGAYSHEDHSPNEYTVEVTEWVLLECQSCSMPALQQNTLQAGLLMKEAPRTTAIIYPLSRFSLMGIPSSIEKQYQAALKVRNVEPSACAVLAGRTLEAICIYEKAGGKTLAEKLTYLASTGRIPDTLAHMTHQLRQIRSMGAHDTEKHITEEDIPIILGFLEAILEYLYVAPAKGAAVSGRRTRG
jgi:hypothetical protein